MERTIKNNDRNHQGGNWIRQDLRFSIVVLRDKAQCSYCRKTVAADGISLTLDHITPVSVCEKPKNSPTNLATCCSDCNSKRGNRLLIEWLREEFGDDHAAETVLIVNHLRRQKISSKDREFARRILATRSITSFTGNAHRITV